MVRFWHFQSQICSRCTKALERRDKTVFGTIVRFGLFQSEKALERWDKTVFATMVIVWRFHAESWKSVLLWLHNRNRVTRHRICSKPLQSNYLITWCRQWMLILIEGQVEIFVSTLKEFLKTTFLTFRFPNENSWDFPDLFTQCAQKRWKQWEKTVFGTMVRFWHFQSQICSRCTKALEWRDKTVFGTIVRFGLFHIRKSAGTVR